MTVYERVARLLAQYDVKAWEPLTQRERDVYMMRAAAVVAAVVAVVDIAQADEQRVSVDRAALREVLILAEMQCDDAGWDADSRAENAESMARIRIALGIA